MIVQTDLQQRHAQHVSAQLPDVARVARGHALVDDVGVQGGQIQVGDRAHENQEEDHSDGLPVRLQVSGQQSRHLVDLYLALRLGRRLFAQHCQGPIGKLAQQPRQLQPIGLRQRPYGAIDIVAQSVSLLLHTLPALGSEKDPGKTPVDLVGPADHRSGPTQRVQYHAHARSGEMQDFTQLSLADALPATEKGQGYDLSVVDALLGPHLGHDQAVDVHHAAKSMKRSGSQLVDVLKLRSPVVACAGGVGTTSQNQLSMLPLLVSV